MIFVCTFLTRYKNTILTICKYYFNSEIYKKTYSTKKVNGCHNNKL